MKYYVTLGEREFEVELDSDQVVVDGTRYHADLHRVTGTPLSQLTVDGVSRLLAVLRQGRGRWSLGRLGEHWDVEVLDERSRHIRQLTGAGTVKAGPASLRAPMPGMVVRYLIEPGQEVAEGQGLAVLEAMKMENELRAPAAGVVASLVVPAGAAVEKGEVLVEFAHS